MVFSGGFVSLGSMGFGVVVAFCFVVALVETSDTVDCVFLIFWGFALYACLFVCFCELFRGVPAYGVFG